MMSVFGGVGGAKVTGGGVYFLPGRYTVSIKACKTQASSVKAKTFAIVECEITESTNSDRPSGSSASQVIDMTQEMGPVNVKAFIAAALEVNANAADLNAEIEQKAFDLTGRRTTVEQVCLWIFSDENPMAGVTMRLEAVEIMTKKSRQPFTKHIWSV